MKTVIDYKRRIRSLRLAILCLLCKIKANPVNVIETKKKVAFLYLVYKHYVRRSNKGVRSMWVRPAFTVQQRLLQGDSHNLLLLLQEDRSMYFNYLRMNLQTFNALHDLIAPAITKMHAVREPISSVTRLQITLRYLATGDCMRSVAYAFRCSSNTVSGIVHETCEAIWTNLKDLVLKTPCKEKWLEIADEYEDMWNFPNCIGAIDGKHIVIQAPANSGSAYYNYKKNFSFNLTGIADALYRFILVDVGAAGRCSDAGVFNNSSIKAAIENNCLNIPSARPIQGKTEALPFTFVGDEAYPLSTYIMRPYPRSSNLDMRKKVFNYRLSRARRVIENTFGIFASRWRIYRKPINTTVSRATTMVLATICLHNFIITQELKLGQQERQYCKIITPTTTDSNLTDLPRTSQKTSRQLANLYREQFADYFINDGAIPWQWEKAANADF